MARPMPESERRRGLRRVGAGFAAVVAVSAGMTAYFSGATLVEAGGIAVGGLLVGALLLVFLGVR